MSSLRCEQLLASFIFLLLGPAQAEVPQWAPNAGQVPSVGCSDGQECVPYQLCQAGVIIPGKVIPRGTVKIPSSKQCESQKYPGKITICCGIPDWDPPTTTASSKGCSAEQECMTKYECRNGVSNTGVPGKLVPRTPSSKTCTDQDQVSGVCCNPNVKNPSSPYIAAQGCGISNADTGSQVADNESTFGQFPWQALMLFKDSKKRCGASIIGTRYLLTAAHCVYRFNVNDITIRVGEWQVNALSEPLPFIDVDLNNITIHNKYNNSNFDNDIAVLELRNPLTMQYHINSICLPPSYGPYLWGQRCISTGWGKDVFDGSFQNILKKVDLPLVSNTAPDHTCQNLLRSNTYLGPAFKVHDSFICAGGEAGKDSCTGDGGGPLACQGAINGRYVLTGITAVGVPDCGEKDVPGLYVDVAAFTDWIHKITNENLSG